MCNNVPKGIQVILAPALEESRTLASNSPKCTRSIRSTGTRVSPCSTYYNRTKVQWERNPDSSIQDTGTNAGRDFRRPEGEGAVEPSKQKKGTGREVQDRTCLGSRRGSVGSGWCRRWRRSLPPLPTSRRESGGFVSPPLPPVCTLLSGCGPKLGFIILGRRYFHVCKPKWNSCLSVW